MRDPRKNLPVKAENAFTLVPMVGAWSPKPCFLGSIPDRRARVARECLFTGAQRQYCIMQGVLADAPRRSALLERYRSGHNEAVLKTVCPYGHMGSNPILSALLPWWNWHTQQT